MGNKALGSYKAVKLSLLSMPIYSYCIQRYVQNFLKKSISAFENSEDPDLPVSFYADPLLLYWCPVMCITLKKKSISAFENSEDPDLPVSFYADPLLLYWCPVMCITLKKNLFPLLKTV